MKSSVPFMDCAALFQLFKSQEFQMKCHNCVFRLVEKNMELHRWQYTQHQFKDALSHFCRNNTRYSTVDNFFLTDGVKRKTCNDPRGRTRGGKCQRQPQDTACETCCSVVFIPDLSFSTTADYDVARDEVKALPHEIRWYYRGRKNSDTNVEGRHL